MAKRIKKLEKEPKKISEKAPIKKKIPLWRWIIIAIPLIVGIMWAISIIAAYNEIPIVYEQASPTGVKSLLSLIFVFIVSYGAFVGIEFRKNMQQF